MKDLAKDRFSSQVALVSDAETELKILTLNSVLRKEEYGTTNKKVMQVINKYIAELESDEVKRNVKTTLTNYASRVYLEWVKIFGTAAVGVVLLATLKAKGINIPQGVQTTLRELPTERQLPDYVYNRTVPNGIYPYEYEKQINAVLDSCAKEDYSERYSLRASVERQLRAEWQQKQLDGLKDSGERFVWIDEHANCSERCQDWQGKLYSLDGTSGNVDGINFRPLEDATERYETTKSGKTYKNGTLTGFNCRHKAIPYRKGNKPIEIPADVIERQRAIEQRQRELERNCRKYETRALGYKEIKENAVDKTEKTRGLKLYKHNRQLVTKWRSEYESFCRKNKVPIYRSRLSV